MWNHAKQLALIIGLLLLFTAPLQFLEAHAAPDPVNVTVTIMRFIELQDPDPAPFQGVGDYYAKVRIGSFGFQDSFALLVDDDPDISPYWTFTRTVDDSLGTVPIVIQIWDDDIGAAAPDDIMDLNPTDGVMELVIVFDLVNGTWTGDVPLNQGFSQGDGDTGHTGPFEGGERGKILFDISLSNNGDIDGDGIPDSVERFGVRDVNGNIVANMAALGADPCRKTIAIEVDFMDGAADGHTHRPQAAAITEAVNAFNAAPVPAVASCPYAGFPTQASGVNLVVDVDDAITEQAVLGLGAAFDAIKTANFNAGRLPYFHYNLWVHDRATNSSSSGVCCSGKDFIVSLGSWGANQNGTVRQQSGTFIHELGHDLGFGHGGGDGINYKPNYLSVMNYAFQTVGLTDNATGTTQIDYSRVDLDDLNETTLNENVGINDGTLMTVWRDLAFAAGGGVGNGALDWTGDDFDTDGTSNNDNPVSVDLNRDRICTTAGPDGNRDTTRSGDDVVFGTQIHTGLDRDCDSTPGGDDGTEAGGVRRAVGWAQPNILTGFDDWTNLKYRAAMSPTAGGVFTTFEDITFEEALIVENFWDAFMLVDAGPDQTVDEGQIVSLAPATFIDPGAELDTHTATIDWGDGTPTEAGVVTENGISGTVAGSHVYADNDLYTVIVEVCDSKDNCVSDELEVTVPNVPPTLDAGIDQIIDEGQTVSLAPATFNDKGTLDTHTAIIDWGEGTVDVGVVTETPFGPPGDTAGADGTIDGYHQYGDNGVFTVTVTVLDDDGATDSDTFDVTVNNVAPTAEIDETGTVLINGIPTFLAHAGETIDFSGRSTDPGSDDLDLTWDWDDGPPSPDVTTTYLVNPPLLDPFPSPSVQPRDVTEIQPHAFADACAYEISFIADDDDGALTEDNANVIIVGNAELVRTAGYWLHQYRQNGKTEFNEDELNCYLAIVGFVSQVFDEVTDASTIENAIDVLFMKQSKGSMDEIFDHQLLAAWLNFANGSVEYFELVDTDGDGVVDTSFADAMIAAEAVRLDPGATLAQLEEQKEILERINQMDE
jgi:hypothetical protein